MPIQTKPLRTLAAQLSAQRRADANAKASREVVEQILAIVGSTRSLSRATVAQRLRSAALTPEAKLSLVKSGLTATEAADVKALLANARLAQMFDASGTNLLKALVGLEPLRPDSFQLVAPPEPPKVALNADAAALAAVRKFREVMGQGKLSAYYDAAIGIGDANLKDEALRLFEALPKLNGATTAAELVAYGLWTHKPKGLDQLEKAARYLPGRQILAPTTVHSNAFDADKFLSYLPEAQGGRPAVTYRATLVGEKDDDFLVKVDGKAEPLAISKEKIYDLNQPHQFQGDQVQLSGMVDYTSAFMKAKLAEAAIKIDPLVAQLDYTKAQVKSGGLSSWFGFGSSQKTSEIQRRCVKTIHDVIDMVYPDGETEQAPGRYRGRDAGRNAVKGSGVCYQQATVMLGMINPFRQALGVDVQFISGSVYRNVRTPDQNPFGAGGHGWLQITYRPSMEMRICDRTWNHADHPVDRAYSRWGDRYPAGAYEKRAVTKVKDSDLNFSGKVSAATFERQFGVQGQDGRENHMTITQART
jgi:hypothetical protein